MRVFRPVVVEGFEWVQPVDQADFDAVYQLDGSPIASRWQPIRVQILETDELGRPRQRGDLPWLGGHALVFRDVAYRAVEEVLASSGEFLELGVPDSKDRLWLYNVCRVVDALDEEASDLVRFPSSGRIMKVKHHVFHEQALAGLVAFRVPQTRSLFLTGDTVDAISALGFRGVGFELVWQSSY